MKPILLFTVALLGFMCTSVFSQSWNNLGTTQYTNNPSYIASDVNQTTGDLYVAVVEADFNNQLKVLRFDGTNWQELGIGANAVLDAQTSIPSVRIHPITGEPWVAYRFVSGGSAFVNIKRFDGAAWIPEGTNIGDPSDFVPVNDKIILRFDASGNAFVAYKAMPTGTFIYIRTNVSGSWTTERIVSRTSTSGPSYDFDYPRFNKILRKMPRLSTDLFRGRVELHFESGSTWSSNIIYNDFNGQISGSTDGFATDGDGSTFICYRNPEGIQHYNGSTPLPFIPNSVNINPISIQMLEGSFVNSKYVMYVENSADVKVTTFDGSSWSELTGLAANIGSVTGDTALMAKMSIRESDGAIFATYKDGTSVTTRIYVPNPPPPRIYVDANATGNNDGSSWADAFTNLQDGINAGTFSADKEVWVASGVYTPTTNVSSRTTAFTVNGDEVAIYGGFDGTETQLSERDWRANQTILSGDLLANDNNAILYNDSSRSENSYNVVRVNANNITIDGVVITGGNANNIAAGAPINQNRGAAIFKSGPFNNFTLRNTSIHRNVSNREGNVGLIFDNGTNDVIIENCIFQNNLIRYSGGFQVSAQSNAIVNLYVYNSLFYENTTRDIQAAGGFSGSSFSAIANDATINAFIINNTFANNSDIATNSSPNDKGTIIFRRLNNTANNVINVEMHNNIFYENYFTSGNVLATSDIGLMNRASNLLNSMNFTHNITANEASLSARVTTLTTNTNVNSNPMFTDVMADDYRPVSGSPAVNVGDNSVVPASLVEDLDGTLRIQNTTVDIGAYEFGNLLSNNEFELLNQPKLDVYPNPVQSLLTIDADVAIESIAVYNHLGQLVIKSYQNNQVDVSMLKSNLYLVEIYTVNGNRMVKKIIVK